MDFARSTNDTPRILDSMLMRGYSLRMAGRLDEASAAYAALRSAAENANDERYRLESYLSDAKIAVERGNFTVAGETRRGRRPSLDGAASPEKGRELFDLLVYAVKQLGVRVATGEFDADMKVSLTNDGPITFLVRSRDPAGGVTPAPS